VVNQCRSQAQRALDVVVYGPLGLACWLRDTVPGFVKVFVARGRSEAEQRQRRLQGQVSSARSLGETTLRFTPDVMRFGPEMFRWFEQSMRETSRLAGQAVSSLLGGPDGSSADGSGRGEPSARAVAMPAPADRRARREAAASLPIPDYDELSASQVVERLDGLEPGELVAVRDYEAGHRARRTILFKIDHLEH
jgi:hypothetical protein